MSNDMSIDKILEESLEKALGHKVDVECVTIPLPKSNHTVGDTDKTVTDTITISCSEYEDLIIARAYLELILLNYDPKNSYRISDVVGAVLEMYADGGRNA